MVNERPGMGERGRQRRPRNRGRARAPRGASSGPLVLWRPFLWRGLEDVRTIYENHQMSKNQSLRFAAGSQDHPRSSVWTMVSSTKKDDIYVGTRQSMRMMKLSLHASGIWRYAFTQASGAVFEDTGDRVGGRWVRPLAFTKGWIQGPSIVIPHTGTDDLLTELDESRSKATVWIPGPAEGWALHFTLLLADETVRSTSPAPISDGDVKVGGLARPKGRSVWIYARDVSMEEEQADWVSGFAADMKITYEHERPEKVYSSVFVVNSSDTGGLPAIMEIVLGDRNVFVDSKEGGELEHPQ